MADVTELAEFVERVVGPRLRERHSSIAEVRTLRLRMEELVRTQPGEAERTLSEERPRAQQRSRPRITPVPAARASSPSRPSIVPAAKGGASSGDAGRGDADSRDSTSGTRDSVGPGSLTQRDGRQTDGVAPPSVAAPRSDRTEMSAEVPAPQLTPRSRRWTLIGSALLGACITLGMVGLVNSISHSLDASPSARSDEPGAGNGVAGNTVSGNGALIGQISARQISANQAAANKVSGNAVSPSAGSSLAGSPVAGSPNSMAKLTTPDESERNALSPRATDKIANKVVDTHAIPTSKQGIATDKQGGTAESGKASVAAAAVVARPNKATRADKSTTGAAAGTRAEKGATANNASETKGLTSRPPNRKPGLASSPYPGAKSSL